MIFRKHLVAATLVALLASASLPAHASILGGKKPKTQAPGRRLTAAQSALIDKAVLREREVIRVVKERAPLVETYIQNMRPDPVLLQVPESDQHFLARVDFGKIINDTAYQENPVKSPKGNMFKHSPGPITGLGDSLHLQFHGSGFVQMLLMDSNSFNRQTYNFTFVRNDFLGSIPTAVFDVTPLRGHSLIPRNDKPLGRFFGRIWVETRNGNVVRFNGDFAGSVKDYREFYHFDSWRTHVQPDHSLAT